MIRELGGLVPVRAESLVGQVWGRLRGLILSGQLGPGARLVELEIAGQMGTSQGSVREALQRLEQDGLVERRGRRGTFVTEVSQAEVREIFAVRELVEVFAAESTAARIDDAGLAELEGLVERMREAGRAGDVVSLADWDMAFHQQICLLADRPTLARAWVPLHNQIQRFIVTTHPRYFSPLEAIADTHLPIVTALRARDPAGAAARIREHMALIWARIAAEG